MRRFLINVCFTLISLVCIRCQDNSSERTAEAELKNFYTEYMTLIASSEIDSRKVEIIKQKYCTQELLNKIKKQFELEELDYDPFLKAQDANKENLSTLSVERNKKNIYTVSYIDNYSKDKIEIHLRLNDSLKIESVW